MKRARLLFVLVAAISVSADSAKRTGVQPGSYYPAYVRHGDNKSSNLEVYPTGGSMREIPIPASAELPPRPIAFGQDGKAIFYQRRTSRGLPEEIVKIEFNPDRAIRLIGSEGLGEIWYLTAPHDSTRFFVTGWSGRPGECGAMEIDTETGTHRNLHIGAFPGCGGAIGDISPDGAQMLGHHGEQLSLLNLWTGVDTELGKYPGPAKWSPDGNWIAAVSASRKIVLIDWRHGSKARNLGNAGNGDVQWSPDSRYLLLLKSQVSCLPTLYAASLEIVTVENGERTLVKSSHCRVMGSGFGWINTGVIQ